MQQRAARVTDVEKTCPFWLGSIFAWIGLAKHYYYRVKRRKFVYCSRRVILRSADNDPSHHSYSIADKDSVLYKARCVCIWIYVVFISGSPDYI